MKDFILRARAVHGNLYSYDSFTFISLSIKCTLTCRTHGNFFQTVESHLQGHGCPKCGQLRIAESNRANGEKKRSSKEKFVTKASKVHRDLYRYDRFTYIQSSIKGLITCHIHGDFLQTPATHLRGHGCDKCAKSKTGALNRLNESARSISRIDFIQKAREIHGDIYDYDVFAYAGARTKGTITCKIHQASFEQSPNTHLKGHGCKLCGLEKASESLRYTTAEFIARAKVIHNDLYSYAKTVYVTQHELIIIGCKIHDDFVQTPNNHIFGEQGCPKCCHTISKPETAWLDHLNVPERQRRLQVANKTIRVDGYDPALNTAYQFHGDYWHGNPKVYSCPMTWNKRTKSFMHELYSKTLEKDKLLRDAGYKLIVIWENDYGLSLAINSNTDRDGYDKIDADSETIKKVPAKRGRKPKAKVD
jgi:G:T-mismatch repair DNA endonuclease (very short patch repair protein)